MTYQKPLNRLTRSRLLCVLVVAAVASNVGCDSDSGDDIPTTIPAAAFSVRTDLFQSARPGAGDHFGAAVERLQPVATGFREHLDLAQAVAIASERLTPTATGDDFVWNGVADLEGEPVTFELTATPASADIVDWFINVTYNVGSTALTDFQLVRARTLTSAAVGEWNQYAMIDGVRTLIFRAEYGAVDLDRIVRVAVEDTVNLAVAADSLEYSEFANNVRELLWFDGDTEDAFFVQWDEGSNAGWLVATDYNESAQSCWDDTLADVECE
ncbi:MAG: hypothetical protein KJO98_07290 [Rhodothermia bacterium]|nr:hypothetical protein [Rhodothermia bacterium]